MGLNVNILHHASHHALRCLLLITQDPQPWYISNEAGALISMVTGAITCDVVSKARESTGEKSP